MLTGIRFRAEPTSEQAQRLSQWMGCARVIWNAKCEEDRYLRTYARKYLPMGTFPSVDQSYSQYKSELTPWLNECPSQILRNSATIWHQTYQKFLKGMCGRPVRKKKDGTGYLWLTRELFRLEQVDGQWTLILGTQRNHLGTLKINWHRKPCQDQLPASIWIRKRAGRWTVSFSYDDGHIAPDSTPQDHLHWLRQCSANELEEMITGLDRGIARPVQTHDTTYCPRKAVVAKQEGREKYIKRCQRKLARQQKGSKRREQTKRRIALLHQQTANARHDFLHWASRQIVTKAQVIVMEDLKLKNMTKRPKTKQNKVTGKWDRNNASAKAGLNKALLGTGLGMLETYITYKAEREGKPVFKVNPINTSRECAACGYIHPDNRPTQSEFCCQRCGHTDNADHNAALVIRKRAIQLILHPGTGLSGRRGNVLIPAGTDAKAKPCKTREAKATCATVGPSKKKAFERAPEARCL